MNCSLIAEKGRLVPGAVAAIETIVWEFTQRRLAETFLDLSRRLAEQGLKLAYKGRINGINAELAAAALADLLCSPGCSPRPCARVYRTA